MIVLFITLRLRAPWCHSLKEKRSEIKRLMHALSSRFPLTLAESGLQDTHDRMQISLAQLAFDAAQAEQMQQAIEDFVLGATQAELYDFEVEYR